MEIMHLWNCYLLRLKDASNSLDIWKIDDLKFR